MTDLKMIEREAKRLMEAHGVGRLRFSFDNSKSHIGVTYHQTVNGVCLASEIRLSKHFVASMSMDEIHQTMLHEIAHALTPGHGHDAVWKATARRLGCEPKARKALKNAPKSLWEGHCPRCGNLAGRQNRAPLRVYACGRASCKGTDFISRALVWSKRGVVQSVAQMPERYRIEHMRLELTSQKAAS